MLDLWEPLKLDKIMTPEGRKYITPSGALYTSVTTWLNQFGKDDLDRWREAVGAVEANRVSTRAADRGTRLHDWVARRLIQGSLEFDKNDFLLYPIERMIEIELQKISKIHLIESALYSDILKLAGTVDCVGVFDNELSVIDFKTSTNPKSKHEIGNYFLQTCLYSLMVEENYGIKIKKLVIIIGTEFGMAQVFVENREDWTPKLAKLIKGHIIANT